MTFASDSAAGTSSARWQLHPDRALPADGRTGEIAREIFAQIRDLPIVSMHGHVEAEMLDQNDHFPDPAALLVTPDHYLVRMLISRSTSPGPIRDAGVRTVADLGVGADGEQDSRLIWRRFCAGWKEFRGTPTRYWLEHVFAEVFEVPEAPSVENADEIFDHIQLRLQSDGYRPRALFDRFNIEVLATTDDPASSLAAHERLARDGWGEKVIPTMRPDAMFAIADAEWWSRVEGLATASGIDIDSYGDYLEAFRARRRQFVAAGALATDHGHQSARFAPLDEADARRLFDRARRGDATAADADVFAAHMLFHMAQMATEDGLVMQLHPGVLRNHDRGAAARFGPNIGFDIPVSTEYTQALRPVLEAFGNHPNFRMIVFTVDETSFSRELAPLAGAYPALRVGAPWWFLDAPDAMRRFREASVETAGLSNFSGFVDDTRAFCSIPARHDLARRSDAGYLARLVAEHRLSLDEAIDSAIDLTYRLPRESYARPESQQGDR